VAVHLALQIHAFDSRTILEWTIHDDRGEIVAERRTSRVAINLCKQRREHGIR
jgi:hypothetical protein